MFFFGSIDNTLFLPRIATLSYWCSFHIKMPGGSTKKKKQKQKKKQDNRHAVTRSNGDDDASSTPSPDQHSYETNINEHVKIIIKAEDGEFVLFILAYYFIL